MKRSLVALVAVAVVLAVSSPVMAALGPQGCAILQEAVKSSPKLQATLNNSGCPTPTASVGASGGGRVAASEPLALLTVGIGLLGAGLLRRRGGAVPGGDRPGGRFARPRRPARFT